MKNTAINSLSFQRVLQLCKKYVAIKKRMIQVGFAVITSLIALMTIWMLNFMPDDHRSLTSVFSFAYMLFQYAGYALSSTMFNELNEKGSAPQYFMLPAKTSEKLLSAWLISYVVYTIVGLFFLYIFSLIIGMETGAILTMNYFNEFMIYTILQSIFIFGAVYFKANNFLSTLLSLFVFIIIITLFYLGLKTSIPGFESWLSNSLSVLDSTIFIDVSTGLLFTIMISAMFIWFTFLRLKTRQIA
jgi:hypothetical protein